MPSSSADRPTGGASVPVDELRLFNIFRELSDEKLSKIAETISTQQVAQGDAVIQDGDEGDTFYLLLDGEVEITKVLVMRMSEQEVDQTDKSLIRLTSEPHPQFGKPAFGEMALFSDSSKRSATVTATEPCRLGVITHKDFLALCDTDTEIGYRVIKNIATVLSDRLIKANQDILNLTTALSFVLTSR